MSMEWINLTFHLYPDELLKKIELNIFSNKCSYFYGIPFCNLLDFHSQSKHYQILLTLFSLSVSRLN